MSNLPEQNSIRLASINIEGDKHREAVVAFLLDFKPDVVCFEELAVPSIEFFEKALNMKGHFLPMMKTHTMPGDFTSLLETFGVGIFSNLPISDTGSDYYYLGSGNLPTLKFKDGATDETTLWRGLLRADIKKGDKLYTVAVTHFTRTPNGCPDDKQRRDIKNLLALLSEIPEVILCGDFNAPRGMEIFSMLSEKYKDNIPERYTSSLDPKLHTLRNSKMYMVDGLFTTPYYVVTDVKLSEGISDHMAVTAIIGTKE
jgi:endonuclease/exonuclease/phosphatase family metal-dependent hydrolase